MTGPAAPAALLGQVADALNACERAGLVIRLAHGTVVTGHGYVLAVGDPRLGARWQARTRMPHPDGHGQPGNDSDGS